MFQRDLLIVIFQCRCHWRNEGRRCERLKNIRNPHFHGNSYLSYGVPVQTLEEGRLELRVQFTTTTEVGLIAFVHNDDTSVFLAVYIEHGTLKFRLSCGNHQMTLVETKHNVTNGAPQSLYIRYHLCNFFKFSLVVVVVVVVVVNRHVNIELKTGLDAVIESIHW